MGDDIEKIELPLDPGCCQETEYQKPMYPHKSGAKVEYQRYKPMIRLNN